MLSLFEALEVQERTPISVFKLNIDSLSGRYIDMVMNINLGEIPDK